MKIYKLDIDTSKPIRKVVQMQQNSTGVLSVIVANKNKYIRNLSCELYDGNTNLSAFEDNGDVVSYKLDVGDEPQELKFIAHAQPYECSAEYVLSAPEGSRPKQVALNLMQISAGTYYQDEFQSLLRFAPNNAASQGLATVLPVNTADLSNANFSRITLMPWNPYKQVFFNDDNGTLPDDALIVVTGNTRIYKTVSVKVKTPTSQVTLSSYNYPAVGYYSDYSLDTVILPSGNAHCYAEYELTSPAPSAETSSEVSSDLSTDVEG